PEKYDLEKIKFSGFLAQEVESAAQASGYDFSGLTKPKKETELYTLSYESFVVPLVKAVQEQQSIIESQTKKIDEQTLKIEDQTLKIDSQASTINGLDERLKALEQILIDRGNQKTK